ncbi:MAG: ABC transporter permease, partial [Sedimenticolaceae bacterium]
MSNGAAHADASTAQAAVVHDFLKSASRRFFNGFVGLATLFVLWWIGGYALSANPATESFSDFGPIPTFEAIPALWEAGKIQSAVVASGYRLGMGLLIAFAIGVPLGILMGRSKRFRELSNSPFQLLRMVSPLSWMPLAVLIFVASWDQSIIFLI